MQGFGILSKASTSELFLKKPVVSDEVQKAYEAFARAACVLKKPPPVAAGGGACPDAFAGAHAG